MAGVNKVIIIGNAGDDPAIRYTQSGDAIATLSVATSETWSDKSTGTKQERTEWHRIVLFRRMAEIAGEYVRKGVKVYIEGKLQTRKWQDKNGLDRYTTEVVASNIQLIDTKAKPKTTARKKASKPAQSQQQDLDDDIPF